VLVGAQIFRDHGFPANGARFARPVSRIMMVMRNLRVGIENSFDEESKLKFNLELTL
jgi:hypothetical protein